MNNWSDYARGYGTRARDASRQLALVTSELKNKWLKTAAAELRRRSAELIAENAKDVAAGPSFGLNAAAIDRLTLNEKRIDGIAMALEEVAALPDPVGEEIERSTRPNGLKIRRVRVPLGVVFFIYESRPNVTADAAAICVKSGNAVILRGGKEALHSNLAIDRLLSRTLSDCGLPKNAVQLVDSTDRDAVGSFLKLNEFIDVTIPRGGKTLIQRVANEATMPVIKHFDGVCHVYVDKTADLAMAEKILINSKVQRPGVCNAAESFLVHRDVASSFLKSAGLSLEKAGVEIRGDARVREHVPSAKPATEQDYRTEYLDLIISAKVVDDLQQAIEHINEYGSHHTDAIITRDDDSASRFTAAVDSSAVMVNASTRFNDGGELGLGAEIGISTDKFHARGPCGLRELTSYKYVVEGTCQIRG